jgi:hypothetical protein
MRTVVEKRRKLKPILGLAGNFQKKKTQKLRKNFFGTLHNSDVAVFADVSDCDESGFVHTCLYQQLRNMHCGTHICYISDGTGF